MRAHTFIAGEVLAGAAFLGTLAAPAVAGPVESPYTVAFASKLGDFGKGLSLTSMTLVRERAGRLTVHTVTAPTSVTPIGTVSLNFTRGACGRSPGRTLRIPLRRIAGGALDYSGAARLTAAAGGSDASRTQLGAFSAARVRFDRDEDGALEEVACGRLLRGPRGARAAVGWLPGRLQTWSAQPQGSGPSGVSAVVAGAERSGRLRFHVSIAALAERTPDDILLPTLQFALSRAECDQPDNGLAAAKWEISGGLDAGKNEWSATRTIPMSTRSARSLITAPSRTLRISVARPDGSLQRVSCEAYYVPGKSPPYNR